MKNNYTKRINTINNIFHGIQKNFNFNTQVKDSWSKENINEWVSDLDIEINQYIQNQIKKLFPNDEIYSEESDNKLKLSSSWIIDPIDGTHNFLIGSSSFGVIIAYMRSNEITCCGILLPKLDESWLSEKGKGVWLNNRRYKRINFKFKPFIFGHSALRYENSKYLNLLKDIDEKGYSIRLNGSTSSDTALLAKSKGVMIHTSTKLYDVASSVCIFRELGAEVLDINMKKWTPKSTSILIFYNLQEKERKLIKGLIKKNLF